MSVRERNARFTNYDMVGGILRICGGFHTYESKNMVNGFRLLNVLVFHKGNCGEIVLLEISFCIEACLYWILIGSRFTIGLRKGATSGSCMTT